MRRNGLPSRLHPYQDSRIDRLRKDRKFLGNCLVLLLADYHHSHHHLRHCAALVLGVSHRSDPTIHRYLNPHTKKVLC